MAWKSITDSGILQASTLSPLSTARRPGGWAIDDDDRPHITDLASSAVPAGAIHLGGLAFKSDGTLYCTSDAPSGAQMIGGQAVRNDGALHITTSDPDAFLGRWGHTANGAACVNTPEDILLDGAAWWRGDREVTLNGTTVSSWGDLTGNNNDATQAMDADQPTFVDSAIGGKPGLQSDGNDSMSISDFAYTTSALTVVLVCKLISSGSNQFGLFGHYNATGDQRSWRISYTSSGSFFVDLSSDGTAAATESSSVSSVSAGNRILVMRFDGSQPSGSRLKLRVDGAEENNSVSFTSLHNSTADLNLFGGAANGTIIAEPIILAQSVTDTEMSSIEQYLSARYNIPLA